MVKGRIKESDGGYVECDTDDWGDVEQLLSLDDLKLDESEFGWYGRNELNITVLSEYHGGYSTSYVEGFTPYEAFTLRAGTYRVAKYKIYKYKCEAHDHHGARDNCNDCDDCRDDGHLIGIKFLAVYDNNVEFDIDTTEVSFVWPAKAGANVAFEVGNDQNFILWAGKRK